MINELAKVKGVKKVIRNKVANIFFMAVNTSKLKEKSRTFILVLLLQALILLGCGRLRFLSRIEWICQVTFDVILSVVVIIAKVFRPFISGHGAGSITFGIVSVTHFDI